MKHIYLFSGLGVDGRVFQFLNLSEYHTTCIQWTPHEKQDSLQDYGKKLLLQITTPKPILIGVSFGGLVAIEVSKHIETEKIILISSVKKRNELPLSFRLSAYTKLHHIMPAKFMKQPNTVLNWFFGISDVWEKEMLNNILHDTDVHFLKWAIDKIVTWNNKVIPNNLTHIHGTADRIMPFNLANSDIPIINGGHFMVVSKAPEVSIVLNELLIE